MKSISITEKPLVDKREYRLITLDNELEALLIHDPETDKASAALDVNVGSFSDPADLNGLAHFCEHLLFMGTAKYPKENEYNEFLSAHGGHSNAYTSSDDTNYYFEVGPEHLEKALDIFAQFFIEPLFSESCKDREVRAVDSENKKNLQNDLWRLHQLDRSLSNPKHPISKFSTGNLETLEENPNSQNINVRDRLIQFYKEHYSANLMKVVVIGRESLDQLQEWVTEKFSAVPNTNKSKPFYDASPYAPENINVLIKAKPVKDIKRLSLRFPIPDLLDYYEIKPAQYLSHCIGHEGPGSLLHYFKEKGLASELSAGAMRISKGHEFYIIDIDLNPEGVEKYDQVLLNVFEYLKLLNSNKIEEWLYKELETMARVNFWYKSKTDASRTTSHLASQMQRPIPREQILSSSLIRDFDPEAIGKIIACLNPDNFRATLVAQSLEGLDKTEKWYGTEYSIQKFDDEFVKKLHNVGQNPDLYLPAKNEFIPENLNVDVLKVESPLKQPILLKNTKQLKVWYKKDDTFWTPKARVKVLIKSPSTYNSPASFAKTVLLLNLLDDEILKFSYAAEIAGLTGSVSSFKEGIVINASGYNDKLHVLLEDILKTIKSIEIKEANFNIWKERTIRSYRNHSFGVPYSQSNSHFTYLLNETTWTLEEKETALAGVTFEDLVEHSKKFLQYGRIEVGAFGNLSKKDALQIADSTIEILKPLPLSPSEDVALRSYFLPESALYNYTIKLKDENNINSCIEYFIQCGLSTEKRTGPVLELFAAIVHEPIFNQLRTKEQLGYVVFSGIRPTRTTQGFRILIQSEKTTDYLAKRVNYFLSNKVSNIIKSLSSEEFEKFKASLIAKKLEKHQNLSEESEHYFGQISSGFYDFLGYERDVEVLRDVKVEEVLEFFEKHIAPASTTRSAVVVNLVSQKSKGDELEDLASILLNISDDNGVRIEVPEMVKISEQIKGKSVPEVLQFVEKFFVEEKKIEKAKAQDIIAKTVAEIANNPNAGIIVDDIGEFKAGLILTAAPLPKVDLTHYLENGKL